LKSLSHNKHIFIVPFSTKERYPVELTGDFDKNLFKNDNKANLKLNILDNFTELVKKQNKFHSKSVYASGSSAILSSFLLLAVEPPDLDLFIPIISSITGSTYWHMYSRGARDMTEDLFKSSETAMKEMKDVTHFYTEEKDIKNEHSEIISRTINSACRESDNWYETFISTTALTVGACFVGFIYVPLLFIPTLMSLSVPYCLGSYYIARTEWGLIRKKFT